MRNLFAILVLALSPLPAMAEAPSPDKMAPLVARVNELFFQALNEQNEPVQRSFFSPPLAKMATEQAWAEQRVRIEGKLGPTPLYQPHNVTWYPQDALFVAIDFSAEVVPDNTYVCGYLVWMMPDENTIGLARIEENIIDVSVVQTMQPETLAETLSAWNCPAGLAAHILGLSKP